MTFRRRNKIKLPVEEDNETKDSKRKDISVKISYDKDESDSNDDGDDNSDSIPAIKFKRRSGKATFLSGHTLSNSSSLPESTGEQNKAEPANHDDDTESYKDVYSKVPSKSQVLNLEDEDEIDGIEQEDDIDKDTTETYSRADIEKIKQHREAIRNKLNQSTEAENGTPSERDYAKLLTTEEKLDLMDTIKDNGGMAKANEHKDFTNVEEYVDKRLEDERLALTENEKSQQAEARRNMIQDAIDREDSNDAATREWQFNITQHGTNMQQDNVKKNNSQLPVLWPDHDTADDTTFIEDELKKISVQRKTAQMKYDAMNKESATLKTRRRQILAELASLGR